MSVDVKIVNPDNDFFIAQNYVLQLKAEKKITSDAFVLYCFYKSLSGFAEIKCSYDYIVKNTGISKGNITKCNKLLVDNNLIKLRGNGINKAYKIHLAPNQKIPRRQLKKLEQYQKFCPAGSPAEPKAPQRSSHERSGSPHEHPRSPDELIYIENKNINIIYNTTTGKSYELNKEQVKFINLFKNEWCSRNKTSFYPKNDLFKVLEIEDINDALKYIPILWSLDSVDKWIKNSDHTISVFVKEYKAGKLQSLYPNTIYYSQALGEKIYGTNNK